MSAPYLLFSAQPGLAAVSAKAGPVDGACETVHGLSAARDAALSALRARRAARSRGAIIWASCFLLVISVACWMKGAFVRPDRIRDDAGHRRSCSCSCSCSRAAVYFIGDKFHSRAMIASADSQLRGDWQAFTPERLQSGTRSKATLSSSILPRPGALPANSTRPVFSKLAPCAKHFNAAAS